MYAYRKKISICALHYTVYLQRKVLGVLKLICSYLVYKLSKSALYYASIILNALACLLCLKIMLA